MIRSLLTCVVLGSLFSLSACASDAAAEDEAEGASQDLTAKKSVPIKTEKTFTQTTSFSRDYGVGDAAFAATAIMTTTGTISIDTILNVEASTKLGKLDSFRGDLTGKWAATADIDVHLQLTGGASKNAELVRKFSKEAEGHLLNGRTTLMFIPIPTGLDVGTAKVNAGIEVALACALSSDSQFNARAVTGMRSDVGFGLEWTRKPTGRNGGDEQRWQVQKSTSKPTFDKPKFDVLEGTANFRMRCGLQPSVNLEVEVGAGELANSGVGARLVGEVYAIAEGSIEQTKWKADYDIGMSGAFEVFANASVLGKEKEESKSVPVFGGPNEPLHLGKKQFEGTLALPRL